MTVYRCGQDRHAEGYRVSGETKRSLSPHSHSERSDQLTLNHNKHNQFTGSHLNSHWQVFDIIEELTAA